MEHYIGSKQIELAIELKDMFTPDKGEMVEVLFTDGTKEIMPKQRLNLLSSETKTDATQERKVLVARVASIIFALMHEYGIKWGEVNVILDGVVSLVNEGYAKASNIKFGVEDKEEITLNSINKILIDARSTKEENNDGTPSDGSGTDSKDTGTL